MSSRHKAGSDSGIDRALVIIFLLWVVISIVLAVMLVLEAHCQSLCGVFPSRETLCSKKVAVLTVR